MPDTFKAVLFDMGETLYTYEGLPLSWKAHYHRAWAKALAEGGIAPTNGQLDVLADRMNRFNTREFPRDTEHDSAEILGGALAAIGYGADRLEPITDGFFGYFRQTLAPYPETVAALTALRARDIRIGALTDVAYGMPRRFIADDLAQVGILDRIDCWKTSVEIGFRKPRPEGFHALCREAGCRPGQAVYVGNERKDVDGANRAGLTSVLIHRSDSAPPDWGQDVTIRSLLECVSLFP